MSNTQELRAEFFRMEQLVAPTEMQPRTNEDQAQVEHNRWQQTFPGDISDYINKFRYRDIAAFKDNVIALTTPSGQMHI